MEVNARLGALEGRGVTFSFQLAGKWRFLRARGVSGSIRSKISYIRKGIRGVGGIGKKERGIWEQSTYIDGA
jgi:hypothetical protein